MHYLLFYDYAPGMLERRAPFRAGHLALAGEFHAAGKLLIAGAFADPVDGAAFVFNVDDPAEIDAFIRRDPYVANGLVTAHRIRKWTVVIGLE